MQSQAGKKVFEVVLVTGFRRMDVENLLRCQTAPVGHHEGIVIFIKQAGIVLLKPPDGNPLRLGDSNGFVCKLGAGGGNTAGQTG